MQSSVVPHPRQSEQGHVLERATNDAEPIPNPSLKPKSPPFIELTSPGSNDGKSQLLYYVASISTLPARLGDILLDGQGASIVVLDTENRFSAARLMQVMKHYISSRISSFEDSARSAQPASPVPVIPSMQEMEKSAFEALKHVHVFRPQSLASLISTVEHLPTYLFSPSRHFSRDRRLAAILLDSASAFFWQDRAEVAFASLPKDSTIPTPATINTATATNTTTTNATTSSQQKPGSKYIKLASALKKTSASLKSAVLYTTWNLSGPPSSSSASMAPFHVSAAGRDQSRTGHGYSSGSTATIRPHLPAPWPSLPTLRLAMARRRVRKFPVGVGVEEAAVRGSEERERALAGAVFEVWIDGWGSEEWSEHVLGGVRRVGGGVFGVRITEQGVLVVDS